jgi:hypothetical protein
MFLMVVNLNPVFEQPIGTCAALQMIIRAARRRDTVHSLFTPFLSLGYHGLLVTDNR